MKQVLIHFDFPQGTRQQYDNVWKELKANGYANPKGLHYHVCAEKPSGGFLVIDVWESEAAFKEFSNVLRPIMERQDIPPTLPQIMPVYNIYEKEAVLPH